MTNDPNVVSYVMLDFNTTGLRLSIPTPYPSLELLFFVQFASVICFPIVHLMDYLTSGG
jgi:hypothetical protein